MRSYPLNHPLFGASEEIIAIVVIAERIGTHVAEFALLNRLGILAGNGDRQAEAVLKIAEYLKVSPQMMNEFWDRGQQTPVPETLEEVTRRLILTAIDLAELNAKMINTLFGVGLITKADRDEIVNRYRLAA